MVSQRKAEAVRNSVAKAFGVGEGEIGPKIIRDWNRDGDVVIVWEEGPYEWTLAYCDLAAGYTAIDEEFGFRRKPIKPVKGVFTEPYTASVLEIYDDE